MEGKWIDFSPLIFQKFGKLAPKTVLVSHTVASLMLTMYDGKLTHYFLFWDHISIYS